MFSAPALLIIGGLACLAIVCSIFPVAPTPRASLVLLIGAISCFFVSVQLGFLIAAVLVGLVILDALLSAKQIDVRRNVPNQLARGVPAPFRITSSVTEQSKNTKSNFTDVQIRQPRCADVYLSKKQATNDLSGTITAMRRGIHELPPFATRVVGPLGLAMWHRPKDETHEIKVFPDLPAAHRLAQSIQQGKFATAGLKRKGPLGLGTNFESVRDYFLDDDIRNVNWSATARTGKPMTNQYRVEQDRDIMVLLDTGRLMAAPLVLDSIESANDLFEFRAQEDEEQSNTVLATRLDIALDALCGVVSVADVMGDRAGVVAFASSVKKHLRPRRAGARAVIRTVFDLEAIPVDSDFEAACQRVGKSKRSFVLILTDIMDPQSCQPLIRALRTVVKKHRVVVASIIDPDVSTILDIQNPTYEESLIKVGATQMEQAAQSAIKQIKDAGAEVVFCKHEDFMLECVKTYLAAKQRAAI